MKYNKNEVTGKMRDRIILQNVNRSRSLTGFASESWADVATIWAFAESKLLGSNETIIEGKNTAKNICDFTIRYISSITEESRVVFKNKIYQVKNIKISHDRRFISFQGVYYDSYSTVIVLQLCSASLLAQSSLSAASMRVIKYQASLNAFGSVSADISFVQKVASSLNASSSLISNLQLAKNVESNLTANGNVNANINFVQKPEASLNAFVTLVSDLKIAKTFESLLNVNGTLVSDLKIAKNAEALLNANALLSGDISFVKNAEANLSALASLSGDISFVQKAQASLLTSASVTGNITIPKTFNASLLATGTTTADLTVNAPSAFDADATAFFARVTAAGGTLTATEQNAINTLVVQMKADGIWTKMKAIYPMVGGGQANPAAACAQNLKSASFTGTFTTGWTFASTGVRPNGTSAFMDTFLAPLGNLSQNDAHASIYSRTNLLTGSGIDLGNGYSGSNQDFYLSAWYASNGSICNINGSGFSGGSTNVNSLGLFLGQRTLTTNTNIYQNNNLIKTHVAVSTTPVSKTINLGRNTGAEYSNRELAFATLGDSLTTTERANFYTAVQAFQTTLSRQV